MKKPALLLLFFVSIIVVLGVVRVAILNSISTTGIELVNIQNQLVVYKKQNVLLKEHYLDVSSLAAIDKKAKNLGFVEAKSHIYLSAPLPLALNQ